MSNITGTHCSTLVYMCFACILPARALAYSAVSHGAMTEQAMAGLESREAEIAYDLGFHAPKSAGMLPVSPGGEEIVRDGSPLENVVVGAINEDNVHEVIDGKKIAARRPIQHFFNPQVSCNDKVCNGLFGKITASPDWIFENTRLWGNGLISNPIEEQLFSYQDARRYQACALMPKDDGSCQVPGQRAGNDFERRRANAGYLFQSLGHIVHHIQDMAQPQHVRLDSHYHSGNVERGDPSWIGTEQDDAEVLENTLNAFLFNIGALALTWKIHEPSRYEALAVDEVRRQVASGAIEAYPDDIRGIVAPPDFWTNQFDTGLADIASRRFPSAETQYGLVKTEAFEESGDLRDLEVTRYEGEIADFVDLPLPNGAGAEIHREKVVTPEGEEGYAYYIADGFMDSNTGEWVEVTRMARIGLYTNRVGRHIETRFKLPGRHAHETDETIAAHLAVLVPRAVGYSKAFLKYFFRGRLELAVSYSEGQRGFVPTITNATPSEEMIGQFTVVRIAENGDTDEILSKPAWLPTQGTISLDPIPVELLATTDRVGILFQGSLGAEQKNVTTATTSVPVTTVDLAVRKAGFRHEIVNLGDTPFVGNVTLLLGEVALTDAATGRSMFPVNLQPGEKLTGLDLPIGSEAELKVQIEGVSGDSLAVIKQPFQYVAGLTSCGAPLSASGGSEGFSGGIELGERAGEVCLAFEAYKVPDQLDVYFGDRKVYSTDGLVSGAHFKKLRFDPEAIGSTKATVRVDGNADDGTRWVMGVSCPGSNLDCSASENGAIDYRLVEFSFSTSACVYDVVIYVDSVNAWSGAISGSHTFMWNLATGGPHQIKLQILKTSTSCMSPIYRQVRAGGHVLEVDRNGVFYVPDA